MMRHFIGAVLTLVCVLAGPLRADTAERGPVLVELFTSQGCSSCPPADALLHELAEHEGIIALSLHVDYWDYIGWKDSFAQHAFTQRQRAYARAGHRRSIYTPQVIVGGQDAMVGHNAMKIMMALEKHKGTPDAVTIEIVERSDDDSAIRLRLTPKDQSEGASDVQLVRYAPAAAVDIKRGENAGRTIEYTNVVRAWDVLGRWDGTEAEIDVQVPGSESAVLIVQVAGQGRVLGTAQLK